MFRILRPTGKLLKIAWAEPVAEMCINFNGRKRDMIDDIGGESLC